MTQQLGEVFEHLVASIVAKGVVDPFEVVDVQGQHGECSRALHQGIQRQLHGTPVGKAGEGITLSLLAQLAEFFLQQLLACQQGAADGCDLYVPRVDTAQLFAGLGGGQVTGAVCQLA
ncbi:hypothetical protein D3C76_1521180 [compost metagenome]